MTQIKTIVFGAAGFIGTYLIDELPDHSFLAVDIDREAQKHFAKQKIKSFCMDITKPSCFDRLPKGIECVINLASLQPDYVSAEDFNPVKYIEVNTIGTLNILKYCVKNQIPKFIHVISHRGIIEYNRVLRYERAIRETDPLTLDYDDEFAEFAVSEMAATQMVYCYRAKHGLNATILRIPSVFGYGPHLEGFKNGKFQKTGFQTFIDNALKGIPLEVWGDPLIGRDIVYVKDVVSAIIMAANNKDAGGLYNIASGEWLTLDDEAKAINDAFSPKKKGQIIYKPDQPNGIKPCWYNIDKARKVFGWSPQYSFKEMLIDYKKEWRDGRFNFLLEKRKGGYNKDMEE
jgi:UDP-glucose 4-epimerase